MGIISSVVSDVVQGVVRDTAVAGALGVFEAHDKYRDKHPKKTNHSRKSKIVQSPFACSDYKGKQVSDVKEILEQQGFKNIILLPKKDLIIGVLAKEGMIESVTINGRKEFGEHAKFYEEDKVNIIYHTHM